MVLSRLGDFLADSSGLGFAGGALLIGSLLALVVLATFFTKVYSTLRKRRADTNQPTHHAG